MPEFIETQPSSCSCGWDRTSDGGVAVVLWFGRRFVNEAGEGGTYNEVVDLAKRVKADASGPVDEHQARSALQLEPLHRNGQGAPGVVGVEADWERDAVLVQGTLRATPGSWRCGVRTRNEAQAR